MHVCFRVKHQRMHVVGFHEDKPCLAESTAASGKLEAAMSLKNILG